MPASTIGKADVPAYVRSARETRLALPGNALGASFRERVLPARDLL
jgi:hypothetical protein